MRRAAKSRYPAFPGGGNSLPPYSALSRTRPLKLYLTPSDEKTVEELSKAVGKTTKTVVTKSRSIGKNPFEGRSQSERTEETSLLPEDEARRLPLDEIVIVVDAQMPIRAKRVVYYEDPFFKAIHAAQEGGLPFPAAWDAAAGAAGRAPNTEAGRDSPGSNGTRAGETAEANMKRHWTEPSRTFNRGRARTVEEAVVADERRQMEMDLPVQTGLVLDNPGDQDLSEIEIALDNLDALAASIVGNEVDLVSEEAGSDVCDVSTQPLSVDDRVTLKE